MWACPTVDAIGGRLWGLRWWSVFKETLDDIVRRSRRSFKYWTWLIGVSLCFEHTLLLWRMFRHDGVKSLSWLNRSRGGRSSCYLMLRALETGISFLTGCTSIRNNTKPSAVKIHPRLSSFIMGQRTNFNDVSEYPKVSQNLEGWASESVRIACFIFGTTYLHKVMRNRRLTRTNQARPNNSASLPYVWTILERVVNDIRLQGSQNYVRHPCSHKSGEMRGMTWCYTKTSATCLMMHDGNEQPRESLNWS